MTTNKGLFLEQADMECLFKVVANIVIFKAYLNVQSKGFHLVLPSVYKMYFYHTHPSTTLSYPPSPFPLLFLHP
jgi:hypothetical protein